VLSLGSLTLSLFSFGNSPDPTVRGSGIVDVAALPPKSELTQAQRERFLRGIVDLDWGVRAANGGVDFSRVDTVHIAKYARFGNQFYQVVRALQYCKVLNLHTVTFEEEMLFMTGTFETDDGITFSLSERTPRVNTIIGNFLQAPSGFPPLDFTVLEGFRGPYMANVFPGVEPSGDLELFIHIRSGDLFSEPRPLPQYAQPPLGYYRDVILGRQWSKIVLAASDDGNPCVGALIEEARFRIIWERRSIMEDLRLLFSARNLVIGRGTFGVAIAMLSPNLNRLYTFSMESSLIGPHENCWPEADYANGIMRQWDHSPEDFKMMLSHKCDHWEFVERGSNERSPMFIGMG
jgi:hypothetical protein